MIRETKHIFMEKSREKKLKEVLSLIGSFEDLSILDVGPADEEYSPLDNYFEKKYPHQGDITVLSLHPLRDFSKRYPEIKSVSYKGGRFPFDSKQFSIAISNAVIEHVGDYEAQLTFVNEMIRVGQQIYFTTPAREFPIEIHTNLPIIHWLPKHMFDWIVPLIGKGWAAGNYMNLLSKGGLEKLLMASDISDYKITIHRFGPLPLHYAVWGR